MSSFQEKIGSDKIKNYFVHSSILIDVDGASLNNWGKDSTNSQGTDNATAVKKVYKNGRWYAVVAESSLEILVERNFRIKWMGFKSNYTR